MHPLSDTQSLRRALGMFATGITVVTTRDERGTPVGLTVNSFNSVSLEPPLIVWSLSRHLAQRPALEQCEHYAVNVLADDQEAVSRRFASKAPDRFEGLEWDEGPDGTPLLQGCCARLLLRNNLRHEGGDHLVFISEVVGIERFEREPLIYFGGAYRHLAPRN